MSFFRIFPTIDNWITDSSPDARASTRATGSNHGGSPTLRVFSIKDAIGSGSIELARTLLKFNTVELSGKVFVEGVIPSASVSYRLKVFNYIHGETNAESFDLFVFPLSRSWDEGKGVDDDNYRDFGYSNWMSASSTTAWSVSGSDFLTSGYGSASAHFDLGSEDLDVDITSVVNNWLTASAGQAGGIPNHGLVIKLGSTEESNTEDYFLKMFHGKQTKYVDRIPYIEARWDDVVKDNRNNFAFGQTNKLYLYNVVRGELTNIPQPLSVRIQDHLVGASASFTGVFNAGQISTGIASASINIVGTASFSSSFYDIWFSGSTTYITGTFKPIRLTGSQVDEYREYVANIENLKREYDANEEVRLKVNVRRKDFSTHVLHTASFDMDREYIEKMYFSITNDDTGEVVVPYGTGSVEYTKLSYNGDGNYFNLWMNNFVPGFVYRVKFLIDINKYDKKEIDDDFLFKVR